MYKIYLAVGNEGVENYIKSQKSLLEKMLNNDTVTFVGATVYKEGVLQGVNDYHPDVIILREGLQGSVDILDLIYKIRLASDKTRIILITKTRPNGDAFLAEAVHLSVYDLIIGDKISVKDLLKKIVYPTKFVDVAHLVPRITIDEKTNKRIFAAPDVDALVQQRVAEILEAERLAKEAEEAAAAAAQAAAAQAAVAPATEPEPEPEPEPVLKMEEPKINWLKDSADTKIEIREKKTEPELVAEYTLPAIEKPVVPQPEPETTPLVDSKFGFTSIQPIEPMPNMDGQISGRTRINIPEEPQGEKKNKLWNQMKNRFSK